MNAATWFSFVVIAVMTTLTPGPATLLALSNSVRLGARPAFWSSLGNASGLLLVSTLTFSGLGVLLDVSASLFALLKGMGAIYLIYLGTRMWRNKTLSPGLHTGKMPGTALKSQIFMQGLMIALTNPKAIIFFMSIFPLFLNPAAPLFSQFILLTLTFSTCAILSHTVYITLALPISRGLSLPSRMQWFNRSIGTLFALLGLGLLGAQRP